MNTNKDVIEKSGKSVGSGESGQRAVAASGTPEISNPLHKFKILKKAKEKVRAFMDPNDFRGFLLEKLVSEGQEANCPNNFKRVAGIESRCSYEPGKFGILLAGRQYCDEVELVYHLENGIEERKAVKVEAKTYNMEQVPNAPQAELTAVMFTEAYQTPRDKIKEFDIDLITYK
jgi:hypothetical protein